MRFLSPVAVLNSEQDRFGWKIAKNISSSNLLCCSQWSSTSSTLLWRASLSAQHAEACDEVLEAISMASAQKRLGKSQHEEARCGEILQVCALYMQTRCAEAIPQRKGALWHFGPIFHCFSSTAPHPEVDQGWNVASLAWSKRVFTVALGSLDACITSRRRAFGSTSAGVASARDASSRMTSILFSSQSVCSTRHLGHGSQARGVHPPQLGMCSCTTCVPEAKEHQIWCSPSVGWCGSWWGRSWQGSVHG